MVNLLLRLEILSEKLDKLEHVVVRNLIAEHVDELDASRLEDGQVVQGTALLNLELRDNELLQVGLKEL